MEATKHVLAHGGIEDLIRASAESPAQVNHIPLGLGIVHAEEVLVDLDSSILSEIEEEIGGQAIMDLPLEL